MPPINLSKLREQAEKRDKRFLDKMSSWYYRSNTMSLNHVEQHYFVDLRNINSKEEFVDWIIHLNDKEWITAENLKEFIDAVLIIKKIV